MVALDSDRTEHGKFGKVTLGTIVVCGFRELTLGPLKGVVGCVVAN